MKYKTNPKASYDIFFFYILNMLCTYNYYIWDFFN